MLLRVDDIHLHMTIAMLFIILPRGMNVFHLKVVSELTYFQGGLIVVHFHVSSRQIHLQPLIDPNHQW